MGTLSERQRRFVTEYLVDGNGTQAAIRAGYSPATAKQQASRLLTNVYVEAAVVQARQQVERSTIADAAERREVMTALLRDGETNPLARLKAADILNKMDGLYIVKHVDVGPVTVIASPVDERL